MEMYFEANPDTIKFRHTPLAFLNLLQELFNRFLATGSNIRLINKAIKSYIDPKILIATASQATDSVSEEKKEEEKKEEEKNKKKTKKDFKEESA